MSAPESASVPDLTPVTTQPITEVTEAPVLATDVLQGAGAELSLAELGLGSYTPVGLIQNLLEFMHVSIGLPWWGAIIAGGFFCFVLRNLKLIHLHSFSGSKTIKDTDFFFFHT